MKKKLFLAFFMAVCLFSATAQVQKGVTYKGEKTKYKPYETVDHRGEKVKCPQLTQYGEIINYTATMDTLSGGLNGTTEIAVSIKVMGIENADSVGFECATDANFNTIIDRKSHLSCDTILYKDTFTLLMPNTTYYVRAYIANCPGTVYSDTIDVPITSSTYSLSFFARGGSGTMTAQDFTSGVPQNISANTFSRDNADFAGWSTDISGCETWYADTASMTLTADDSLYAQWNTWCTGSPRTINERGNNRIDSVKDHQDNWYKVLQINGFCVMKQNLRMDSSTTTPAGYSLVETSTFNNSTSCYKKFTDFASDEGYLYNWRAAMDLGVDATTIANQDITNHRGLCPEGWHIPTSQEWRALFDTCNAGQLAAYNCSFGSNWASSTDCDNNIPSCNLDEDKNFTLFSAIPIGSYTTGSFQNARYSAFYWSASSTDANTAVRSRIYHSTDTIQYLSVPKVNGFSVRCLRDAEVTLSSSAADTVSICDLSETITYTAALSGSTPTNYAWSVSPSTGATVIAGGTSSDSTYSLQFSAGGSYTIACTVSSASASYTKTTSVYVNSYPLPTFFTCEDCEEGTSSIKALTNTDALYFISSTNDTVSISNPAVDSSVTLGEGQYIVVAQSSNGCVATDTIEIVKQHTTCSNIYSPSAGTLLPNGLYANKEWATGTQIDSVSDHEGNVYEVVQIGDQCWLKENMRALSEPSNPGVSIVTTSKASTKTPYAYFYNFEQAYYDKYGCLYNYNAAMDLTVDYPDITYPHRGICPEGWHIPQDSEWVKMELTVVSPDTSDLNIASKLGYRGQSTEIAVRLAAGCDWNGYKEDPNYTISYANPNRNSSGFSALPGGHLDVNTGRGFLFAGGYAAFWCAEIYKAAGYNDAYFRELADIFPGFGRDHRLPRACGLSVRCLRDPEVMDTITFVANGGSGTMAQQVVIRGQKTSLDTNAYTRTGQFYFAGWDTVASGCYRDIIFADGDSITTSGNVTLYAQWRTYCTGTPNPSSEIGNSRIEMVQDHQGNSYQVVQIGTQCWLKENMRCSSGPTVGNFDIYRSSVNPTLNVTSFSRPTAFVHDCASCDLNGDSQFLEKYGYLYTWCAATDRTNTTTTQTGTIKGICPTGWHLPYYTEYVTMFEYVKNNLVDQSGVTPTPAWTKLCSGSDFTATNTRIATALSAKCDWYGSSVSGSAGIDDAYRNISGFSALPAHDYNTKFWEVYDYALFWTSENLNEKATSFAIGYQNAGIMYNQNTYTKNHVARSVRCVRD